MTLASPLAPTLERIRAREEEHSRTCRSKMCDRCSRFACGRCRKTIVTEYDARCESCRYTEALERIGIPRRYRDASFETSILDQRVKCTAAIGIAAESTMAMAVVLRGPIGAGKTTLLAAMTSARQKAEAIRRTMRRRIVWTSAIALERARAEHRLGAGEAELVDDAIEAGLLCIDDLGAEAARASDVISTVVHARHDAERPLWISTGLSAAEIGARYSAGVERRLFERAILIDCGGSR